MKRPLALICLVSVIAVFVVYAAGYRREDTPPAIAKKAVLRAAEEKPVAVTGRVADVQAVSAGERLSVNQISIQLHNKSVISLSSELKITFTTEKESLLPGDAVTVLGEFAEYGPAGNPGEFDAEAYYASMDVIGRLQNAEILEVNRGGWSLERLLACVRRAAMESYHRILDEKTAGTVSAITLGEKSLMEREWKQVYQEGGIAHILAVSGLHITLIGMGMFRILRCCRAGYGAASAVSGILAFLYTILAGAGISAVRAYVMFLFWLGSQVCGRKNDMVTGVSAAAAFLVFSDVRNLLQSSFLLSFSAVLSLAVLLPAIKEIYGIKSSAGSALAGGIAVWLGTLPCTLWFFYQTAPWSLLVNLAVIPLMSALMMCSLAAAAVGMVCVPAGIFLAAPAYYLLACFEWLCRLQQKLPLPLWVAGRPQLWQAAAFYGILAAGVWYGLRGKRGNTRAGIRRERYGKTQAVAWNIQDRSFVRGRIICALCVILCIAVIAWKDREYLRITCLDVGQGDCALVQFPDGTNCMVDGGSTSQRRIWEYVISPVVKAKGIGKLDYVFLSHADQDHINGIEQFLEEYELGFAGENAHGITLGNLVLPPASDREAFAEIKSLARRKQIGIWQMEAGDAVGNAESAGREGDTAENAEAAVRGRRQKGSFGAGRKPEWEIVCAAPKSGSLTGEPNEDSMVLMLRYGSFRMLFTGDLEEGAERRLADSGICLRADVLKVGHHGSSGGTSGEFLEKVSPRMSVISCGADNPYGHPAQETVERIRDCGSSIFVTSECGAVTVESDGKVFYPYCFKK